MTPFTSLLTGLLLSMCAASLAVETSWPGAAWEQAQPEDVGLSRRELARARDYALTGGGSGVVTRSGKLVFSWGDTRKRYDLKSTTKSIGVTALGLALLDGKLSLDDLAVKRHPSFGVPPESNRKTGWLSTITLRHLATQTAGFAKPGGYEPLLFEPGTKWHYSDGGPNWLAECVTLAYRRDLQDLLFERVFTPIGITPQDLTWRRNSYRPPELEGIPRREFGSGISANVDAMARLGYLYLRRGQWRDAQLLPASFVDLCRTTQPSVVGLPEQDDTHGNASDHYGLLWWNNADGTLPNVPRDAFWSWGLYESLIFVVPSLDLVVARAGKSWQRKGWHGHYEVLGPFFGPLVAAAQQPAPRALTATPVPAFSTRAPYPPSAAITGVQWAPVSTIVRRAEGSDNWPLTWADDDRLYTAYGDGYGFAPRVSRKLSLGLARIGGPAADFHGENLSAPTLEQLGGGAAGKKASSVLMVDGTLFLWARNARNSQLAWSRDHGQTWTWAAWKFTESFGFPVFLNFGRNYANARDTYVYVYSLDGDSAYKPTDRLVLARVPAHRIADRAAYTFLTSFDSKGRPRWSSELDLRGSVFAYPGKCYRFSVSYCSPLKRYLLCQIIPGGDTRFSGGFGIYEAPEPWGPWATAYFTEKWDVGPGECCHLPTKWMSADGKTVHLVFSGQDCFSVRRATLRLEAGR